jgi:AraC-like DNA-binding protein
MSFIEIVSVASISLLLVLASYLLVKGHGQNSSFRWIGLFFLLLAINFGDGLLSLSGYYLDHPSLAGWEEALVLLYGPTLLFFAQSTASTPFKWSLKKGLHLVPFVAFQSSIIFFYQTLPDDQKLQIIANAISHNLPAYVILTQLALLAHFFSYTLYARILVSRQQEQLKNVYSSRMISWAKSIYNYLILLFVLSLVATLIQFSGNPEFYLMAVFIIVVATAIFLFVMLIKALDHPILSVTAPRPSESKLSAQNVQRIREKIEQYLLIEEGYSNPDLTIKDLAEQLIEPARDVSHVVNHHLANNFYDLVNGYRIAAAKNLLSGNTESKIAITDVMYKVGFNSKSSFNTQFKQKTGVTPSAFRRQTK